MEHTYQVQKFLFDSKNDFKYTIPRNSYQFKLQTFTQCETRPNFKNYLRITLTTIVVIGHNSQNVKAI